MRLSLIILSVFCLLILSSPLTGQTRAETIIENPKATLGGLDKITGKNYRFEVAINQNVMFGSLLVTVKTCHSRPETEPQKKLAFLEIDEVTLKKRVRRIFTGWMFESNPALNAVEHAVYDIWLIDCTQ